MPGVLRRLQVWAHWRREQRELDEEMAAHREMKRRKLERTGVLPERLAAATQRALGNDTFLREEARGVWLWPWLEALGQGLRQGMRRLWRAPGFATVAILTLALGIGANTAVFSVVEAVMLRPLPYPHADRIVAYSLWQQRFGSEPSLSMPEILFLRGHARAVSSLAGYRGMGIVELDHGRATDWVRGMLATDGFFATLGVPPRLGRGFQRTDTNPGAAAVVVLSDGLWHAAFGGDPTILGRPVRLDGASATIIGVLPPGFQFQEQAADLYEAIVPGNSLDDRGLNTGLIGRLRPGATRAQAAAEAAALGNAMRNRGLLPSPSDQISVDDYQATETLAVRSSLWFLLGAVGLLLLIACANVAGLTLARTLARQPELAVRRALGASRGRLFTQFLAESLVLAACGGAAGLALAEAALRGLAAHLPWDLPLAGPITLDGRVLGFTLAVAAGASLALGTAAAWTSRERQTAASLARFHRRPWVRDAMVAGEIALTLLLLVGAGLLVKSLVGLERQPLGFDPAGRTVFVTALPAGTAPGAAADRPRVIPTRAGAWQFDQQVLARLRVLPGVSAAAVIDMPPLEGQANLPGEPVVTGPASSQRGPGKPELGTAVEYRVVSPGYFAAMGIPLLRGRNLEERDTAAAPPVAVVSQSLARKWFSPGSVLGGQVRMGAIGDQVYVPALAAAPQTIVGVVGDVKVQSLDRPARLTVYVPAAQAAASATWWVVRGRVDESRIRRAVAAVNAGARVSQVAPYAAVVGRTLAQPRFEARLTGLFALLALALAAVGLYGLLAYAVTERTREIGIRMALGARRGHVLRQVAGHGLALALAGIAVGTAATLPLGGVVASLLYGVQPLDAATLALAAGAVMAVAVVACALPAWHATRVDPAVTLRAE